MSALRKQMHQTTIRFDGELWRRIDAESRRIGVSAAQYVRDAALIRLTHNTGGATADAGRLSESRLRASAAAAIFSSDAVNADSRAVWAQAQQARERARVLRETSQRLSRMRALRRWAGSGWVEHPEMEEAR